MINFPAAKRLTFSAAFLFAFPVPAFAGPALDLADCVRTIRQAAGKKISFGDDVVLTAGDNAYVLGGARTLLARTGGGLIEGLLAVEQANLETRAARATIENAVVPIQGSVRPWQSALVSLMTHDGRDGALARESLRVVARHLATVEPPSRRWEIVHWRSDAEPRARISELAVVASALKHTIHGDVNLVTVAEVEHVLQGNTTGRLVR